MTASLHDRTRTCAWCDTVNTDAAATNCVNCGGPLPALPGMDPGPEPPPPPRTLPVKYRRRVMYWKNVRVLVGMMFTIVGCWTILFPIIGIPVWIKGRKMALAKLAALERGRGARAQVVDVWRDTSVTINGRNPWAIEYSFETAEGTVVKGKAQAWDASNADRRPGQPLWVVYLPEDPEQNAIWPPIK